MDTGAPRALDARGAAFFDLDKTIIATSSTMAFAKPFQAGGLLSRATLLRSLYSRFVYLLGGADHDQMEKMRIFLSEMITGWDVEQVRAIVAETLRDVVDPLVYDEAVQLIEEHRAAGRDVVVVSASGAELVEPIGQMLGVDHVLATQLEVVDGRYSGQIERYVYADGKVEAITELAEAMGYDLAASYGYSDSITDAPMLQAVGHAFAVNPDKELRRLAAERGWPVLVFTRPVSLRSRLAPAAKPTLAAIAVGGVVAVGSVIWTTQRRRRIGI